MGQQKTAPRSNYPLALKVEILNATDAPEASVQAIADERKILSGTIYNWRNNAKAIRSAYAKELKQAERNGNGASVVNGNGATPHKAQPAEKEEIPPLKIIGLTPVIKALVKEEIDKQLPGLVAEAISKAFNKH